jgi:hypothetical protein
MQTCEWFVVCDSGGRGWGGEGEGMVLRHIADITVNNGNNVLQFPLILLFSFFSTFFYFVIFFIANIYSFYLIIQGHFFNLKI